MIELDILSVARFDGGLAAIPGPAPVLVGNLARHSRQSVTEAGVDMSDNEPIRVVAGDRNPLTPQEARDTGAPVGMVMTASLINDLLDRMRAASPTGDLPPHVQAKLDAIHAGRLNNTNTDGDMA